MHTGEVICAVFPLIAPGQGVTSRAATSVLKWVGFSHCLELKENQCLSVMGWLCHLAATKPREWLC